MPKCRIDCASMLDNSRDAMSWQVHVPSRIDAISPQEVDDDGDRAMTIPMTSGDLVDIGKPEDVTILIQDVQTPSSGHILL